MSKPLDNPVAGGTDSAEDIDLEAVIRATFSTLDRWRQIREPFTPLSGSELARDDEDWKHFGVSQVAWTGFTVASENLQAIRAHIDVQKPNRPNLFAFAHQTLARTALVGSATTVWVLAPEDRAKRIERARSVVTYQQDEHLKYLRALQGLADHPETNAVAKHVELRRGELAAKRTADGQKAKYETTRIIREAALAAFGSQALADEVVAGWRSGSGAAHGLIFPVLGGTSMTIGPADEHGRATFAIGGDFNLFANEYMAAYRLAEHGWSLLIRRGR